MADIRTHGREAKEELERHLSEMEEDAKGVHPTDLDPVSEFEEIDAARREIAWLRKEVYDLRERLMLIQTQTMPVEAVPAGRSPMLRMATTVALTFVLGKLVHKMRLGAAGSAAVPLIAAQIDSRIW